MASPKITFMGQQAPGMTGYSTISQDDLLTNGSIAFIETSHNLTINEAVYAGGLAIFGTKDANSSMSVTLSNGTTFSFAEGDTAYGQFYNLDSTHFLLLLKPTAVLDEMGQGSESLKLTSTLSGKSTSSSNFITVDTIAPELSASSPADGSVDAAVNSNITLTYSENVKFSAAGGTITLDANGAGGDITITIDTTGAVTSGNATVTISGKTVTINPTGELANNKTYNVLVTAGLFEDNAGNDAAALVAGNVNFDTTHIISTLDVGDLDRIGVGADSNEYGVTLFGDDDGDLVGDQFGTSVSNAGDVNGDGYDDIIIGSAYADNPYSSASGLAYVVFGGKNGLGIDIDNVDFAALNDLDGTNGGFIISSSNGAVVNLGRSVSTAGDINGDGYADVVVGSTGNLLSAEPGSTFVVYGQKDNFANIDTSTFQFDPSNGFALSNSSSTANMGISVTSVGDLNGDGLADFAVGNSGSVMAPDVGKAYVVFGNGDGYTNSTVQSLATGSTGFTFTGADDGVGQADTTLGFSVSDAGDVNGDGYADMIVGMPFKGSTAPMDATGESYVVFGGASGFATNAADIDAANGSKGFKIMGDTTDLSLLSMGIVGDYSGWSVSSAGDFNGDGLSDLVVSSATGLNAYVVFGKSGTSWGDTVDVGTVSNTEGFTITKSDLSGFGFMGNFGYSVSSAGDVNGDGYDDIIVGQPGDINGTLGSEAGSAYVLFGKGSGFGDIDLSSVTLDGSNGFVINGDHAYEHLGNSVSSAGDLNGDGFDDLIVGAARADATDQTANSVGDEGETYIIYGTEHFGHKVTYNGTIKNDVKTGSTAVDIMVGGRGNDSLNGKGGADVIKGGQGNDIITVSDLNFRLIDGGSGNDTLSLSMASKTLALANENITDIETINLTGTGNNTLKITALDLLGLSDDSNKLTVKGNAGDKLDFDDTGWTLTKDTASFDTYTNGEAVLVIGQAVTVIDFA